MRQCWILLAALPFVSCASAPERMGSGSHAALGDAEVPPELLAVEASEPEPASGVSAAGASAGDPSTTHAIAVSGAAGTGAWSAPEAETWLPSFVSDPARAQYESSPKSKSPVWHKGQGLAQGWFGVTSLTSSERSGGTVPGEPTGDVDLGTLPVIGGGGQWKFAGSGVDIGLEGGINFAFSTNGGFFATGSNGATVAVSIDALLFDLYGGAFISKYLGEHLRIYGAGGPMLQWASYDQSSSDTTYDGDGSGFGYGYYLRAGLEFLVGNGTMVGFSGRWFDTDVDLSGGLGDWDLSGAQILFTVTRSF